ncbi:hypothetical protein [Neptunitalea lumnitzerae]|uniref:Uncharacterized protein n=1 Tax=Neptunitalea lumnitzerae TaxID=2965509 RepID=A0ABQ5MES9_9FLAO|nr:hypothetical protein [Neptunitalea sp. Y10]GLB47889.1 hypothetical protein Y10_02570 [Neptunitalea sp. Y10]
MIHKFYSKTSKEQKKVQIKIGLLALLIIAIGVWIAWFTQVYIIGILIFFIIITLLAPFVDTPSMKQAGRLTYHSLLFITEKPKDNKIKVHGGTLFDYVFVLCKQIPREKRIHFILQQYVEGLIHLITSLENSKEEHIIISGTSYIINERTAKRLGFKVIDTDGLQLIILALNYCNITTSYSIAKGKITLPNIAKTKTFEVSLADLKEKKSYLISLNKKLYSRLK